MIALCAAELGASFIVYIPTSSISDVPNPWHGVTKEPPYHGDQAGGDARTGLCIRLGQQSRRDIPRLAAAAVICFEWLQRPENVLAGYRPMAGLSRCKLPAPSGSSTTRPVGMVLHPLEETTADGKVFVLCGGGGGLGGSSPPRHSNHPASQNRDGTIQARTQPCDYGEVVREAPR